MKPSPKLNSADVIEEAVRDFCLNVVNDLKPPNSLKLKSAKFYNSHTFSKQLKGVLGDDDLLCE